MWAYRNRMGKDGRIDYQAAIEQAVYDIYTRYNMSDWLTSQKRLSEKCMAELEMYLSIKFVMQVLLDTQ